MDVIGVEEVFMMVQNKKSYLRDLATGFSEGEFGFPCAIGVWPCKSMTDRYSDALPIESTAPSLPNTGPARGISARLAGAL